jgi:hypothetical protein
MIVYFARSIRGAHSKGDPSVHDTITTAIKDCGHVPALELPTTVPDKPEWLEAYIYARDINWLNSSGAMIAEVSNPSLGVGYEIAYAQLVRRMPILCLARVGVKVSAMIAGSGLAVQPYNTSDQLIGIVKTFLNRFDSHTEGDR